jgi:tetratricopeptide (TPR) repeat protein
MKKLAFLILILITIALTGVLALDKEQTDSWIALVGEKDLKVKMQKLDDYYNKYGGKEDRNSIYMYLHLAETTYQLQQYERTIEFAEKALTYEGIESSYKLRLYLFLANAYNLTKKDLDMAYSYADKIIILARKLNSATQNNSIINNNYVAPALRIQVQLLAGKPNDPQNAVNALNKALEAYQLDKSDKSANFVLALSERMLKSNNLREAIRGVEAINQNKPHADYFKMLGLWYARLKDQDKAIENLKTSYQMKRNAKVAYDLGVLLNQNDNLDNALDYLAEAHLLNDEKYSEEALKLLQHLIFFVKTKGQPLAEQEKVFNDVVGAAKTRLGITLP